MDKKLAIEIANIIKKQQDETNAAFTVLGVASGFIFSRLGKWRAIRIIIKLLIKQ